MGLIIFYGIVSLLPLFFLYQIYRDVARKRARRKQLTRHFKISGAGNGNLRVAEKFVDDLDSIFPWVSQGAIKRIAKNETQGIQLIVTILDWIYPFIVHG